MSDPWNVKDGETPHDTAATYASLEMLDAEPLQSFDKLYKEGIDALSVAGFVVERDPQGAHCGHNVFRISEPREIAGIDQPPWFRVKRLVETAAEEAVVAVTISNSESLSPEAKAFWLPLTNPKSGAQVSELRGYVDRLLQVDSAFAAQHEDEPFRLGISYTPHECTDEAPRAYLPERSWFKASLHSLRFTDIFTLWPEAEARMLQLILGRVLVGRNNHIPVGRTEPIAHTFRSAAIIVGEDPGLGKSTTFNMLFNALVKIGYRRENFRHLHDRFNLGRVITADIAYKDDVVAKTLRSLLSEEATKTIVSGGQLYVEDKFANGYSAWSNAVVIANSNEYDPRVAYELDPGIVDRMKLLSTYRKSELEELSEASPSPSLLPNMHIPWLADKHGVEESAILLWGMRLAADYFDSLIADRGRENKLADEVHLLTSRLRLQFNKDVTRQTLAAVSLYNTLYGFTSSGLDEKSQAELSKAYIHDALRSFSYVAVNKEFQRLRSLVKRHWELSNRKDAHPWMGTRKLNLGCMRYVRSASHDAISADVPLNDYIQEVFSKLSYRDGFAGSKDIVWVTKSWDTVRFEHKSLQSLAKRLWQCMTDNQEYFEEALYAMRVKNGEMQDAYLHAISYTPTAIGNADTEFNELIAIGTFDPWLI